MRFCRLSSGSLWSSFSVSRRLITFRRSSAIWPNEESSAIRAVRRRELSVARGVSVCSAASLIISSRVTCGARFMLRSTKSPVTSSFCASSMLILRPKRFSHLDCLLSNVFLTFGRITFLYALFDASGFKEQIQCGFFELDPRDSLPILKTMFCPHFWKAEPSSSDQRISRRSV